MAVDGELAMALLEDGADVDHRIDVVAARRVSPDGRLSVCEKLAQAPAAWTRDRGSSRVGEGEDPPAAIRAVTHVPSCIGLASARRMTGAE